jgi:hypothetical protein
MIGEDTIKDGMIHTKNVPSIFQFWKKYWK